MKKQVEHEGEKNLSKRPIQCFKLEVVSKMVLWQREEKKEACEEKRLRETEEDLAI